MVEEWPQMLIPVFYSAKCSKKGIEYGFLLSRNNQEALELQKDKSVDKVVVDTCFLTVDLQLTYSDDVRKSIHQYCQEKKKKASNEIYIVVVPNYSHNRANKLAICLF